MPRQLLTALISLTLGLTAFNQSNPTPQAQPATPSVSAPGAPAGSSATTNAASGTPAAAPSPVIVKDLFQEAINGQEFQNMNVAGTKPVPVDVPGVPWQLATGDGAYETVLTAPSEQGCLAYFHNTASVGLNLASNGPYVKPTVMTLSGDLSFGGDSATGIGVLGFYSALSGEHTGNTLANFTGLILQKDGSLQLIEKGTGVGTPIKFTGKYDPTQPVTLTYSVDTTKGTISNISLTGSTSAYAFTSSAFTPAATAYLGIGGSTGGGSVTYATGLQLTAGIVVPPPPAPPAAPTGDTVTTPTNAP